MKFVYFITSHKNPEQVQRLCAALRKGSPLSEIVVHHDPIAEPLDAEIISLLRIHLIPQPISVRWGDFSLTEAILISMQWIEKNLEYDWLIYISGQDYPVRPLIRIEADLAATEFDAFVYAFLYDDPAHWPSGEGFKRYYFQYFNLPRFPYYYRLPPSMKSAFEFFRQRLNATSFLRLFPAYRNRPPKIGIRCWSVPFHEDFPCWGGYNWMTLRRICVKHIIVTCQNNPRLLNHYRHTLVAEESIFQTILYNSKRFVIENNCRRYIYWDPKIEHAASPATIKINVIDRALSSRADFARKFDFDEDIDVFDRVDAFIDNCHENVCE
ncbi:MAG: hypothetical protein KJ958_12300 [Gammaproteobacteria bacterium]|nr:hypothetical protein [Gammaproteobacteria bacterium]MBU1979938.1 hypothetical protein [Gammaproteobacteria bacterium]